MHRKLGKKEGKSRRIYEDGVIRGKNMGSEGRRMKEAGYMIKAMIIKN